MGAGASKPKLPEVCEKISRKVFQEMLMDIYASYSLLMYYSAIVKESDLNGTGRPPKQLSNDQVKTFDAETRRRIKSRSVETVKVDEKGIPIADTIDRDSKKEFDALIYFNLFGEKYNNAEGDLARFQLLHQAIGVCSEMLDYYVGTLNEICQNENEKFYDGPGRMYSVVDDK
jgi:hypothetical protein